MSFNSKEDLIEWCDSSETKVKKTIDNIIDKLGVQKKGVKSLLTSASEILNELEELKKELK
jgi:hypothetical protein